MGLFIAKEDTGNQVTYHYADAEARLIGLSGGDSGIGFNETFLTTIEGISCIEVTYFKTLSGPINNRLDVLINNSGFDHNNLVTYFPPPHIIIFVVDNNLTAPLGTSVPFGTSLAPGSIGNPLSFHVALVYNAVACGSGSAMAAKAGGGQLFTSPTELLYHELARCFKYVSAGDINDETQATIDENEWRASHSSDLRDINVHSIICTGTGTTTPLPPCFPASTPILTPTGWARIGELEVGDLVMSYQRANGRTQARRVTRRLDHSPTQIWELITDRNEVIPTTASHPFLTKRGWVLAKRLRVGDELITLESETRVISIRKTDRVEPVHNLFTAREHTFVIQGQIVVHNFAYFRTLRTWLHRLFVDWRKRRWLFHQAPKKQTTNKVGGSCCSRIEISVGGTLQH